VPTVEIPIEIRWTGATGSPGANIWHARTDGNIPDPSDPGVGDMLDALQAFYTDIASAVPASAQFRFNGEVTGVGASSGDSQTYDAWVVQGSAPDQYLPPADAVLVSWKTGSGGRSGRGRTFLSPLNRDVAGGTGAVGATWLTLFQGAVDELVATSSGIENGALGVYSRTDNLFRDFTSGTVRPYFAVLRSRRD
jgi:hypothetical protein